MSMLGINMAEHYEEIRSCLQTAKYGSMFKDATQTDSGDTQKPAVEFQFTGRIESLTEKASKFISRISKHLEKGGMLYRVARAVHLFGRDVSTLEDMGLRTVEQKLALIF